MQRRTPTLGVAGVLLVGLVIAAVAVIAYNSARWHDHVATCTITGKDRGYNQQTGSSNYRIYTAQCGTLANTDSMAFGKFNSGDVQGRLVEGHTYRLRIAGWRQPLLSAFPNIISVQGEVARPTH